MGNWFPQPLTEKEMMRENQKLLRKSVRELERETENMIRSERELMAKLKGQGRKNQLRAAKTTAKQLIRIRNAVSRFEEMKCQLEGVAISIRTAQSTASMGRAMQGAARSMYLMNRTINMPQLERILKAFQEESDVLGVKQENMDETLDHILKSDGDEEAEEELLAQVLDEAGIDIADMLGDVPQIMPKSTIPDKELAKRLDNLRREK